MKKIETADLASIVNESFPKAVLDISVLELKLGDIEDWDSLGNFNLLLAFEEFYGVRFSMEEMANLRSIKGIVKSIEDKICPK